MTPRTIRRVRYVLHDDTCERGRWCGQRRSHARTSQDALARRLAACTTRAEVVDVLHIRACSAARLRRIHPDGCPQVRAHAHVVVASPVGRAVLVVAGL